MLEIMEFLYERPVAYFGLLFFILIILWSIKEIVSAFHNPYNLSYTENIIVERNIKENKNE